MISMKMESSTVVDGLTKVLIAQYLKKHHYDNTLSNFLIETSLPLSAVDDHYKQHQVYDDLETIVTERVQFNEHEVSERLKELTINDSLPSIDSDKFHVPCWDHTTKFTAFPGFQPPVGLTIESCFCYNSTLLACTSTKQLYFYDSVSLTQKKVLKLDNVIKRCGMLPVTDVYYYVCGIDGSVSMYGNSFEPIAGFKWRLHNRVITHIKWFNRGRGELLCFSCGLDGFIKMHSLNLSDGKITLLHEVKLLSACTSFQLAQTESGDPVLLLTRLDFTQVMIFVVSQNRLVEHSKIALNNAQFSTHSFNVRDMVLLDFENTTSHANPHLRVLRPGTMLAIATSHIPYMRLILTEIPKLDALGTSQKVNTVVPQVPSILDNFVTPNLHAANVEDKSTASRVPKVYFDKILRNIATTIPQDSYSQPVLRPFLKGRGILVGGDLGVYAVDVSKGDSWIVKSDGSVGESRVKSLDVHDDRIVVSFANRALAVWECQ